MNTDKLEIGMLIYDSYTDMDLTVREKIKSWQPENRSIYILQCEDLGNYNESGCRFFAYKSDLADERYQIKDNQPEAKPDSDGWHDAKAGDLPKKDGHYEVHRHAMASVKSKIQNMFYSSATSGFYDTFEDRLKPGEKYQIDTHHYFKWRKIQSEPKNEKTEPKPEKIPGLVWVKDEGKIFNLNQVCAILQEEHILHFMFNDGIRGWMFKDDKRCREVYEKIRAMGVEL